MSKCKKMKDLELHEEDNIGVDMESDDDDTCKANELKNLFPSCKQSTEYQLTSNKGYILHVDATLETSPSIAASSSNGEINICKFSDAQLAIVNTLTEDANTVVDVRFSVGDNNLCYTGTNANIKLWDTRTPKKRVLEFSDCTASEEVNKRPLTCFDVSPNNLIISAGTELFKGDAYMLFWDARNSKLLGGYWESHTDDITQVKFSPTNSDSLISGSTDGLINLYDISQTSEDDALIDSFNTKSSVESLSWSRLQGKDIISCITHTADVQLWRIEDAEPFMHFRRKDVAQGMMKKTEDFIYVVNTHSLKDGLFLLAGSNAHDGECFRSLNLCNKFLKPAVNFSANKQRVRCSWFNENTNLLITGGEKGILNTWNIGSTY